MKDGIGGRGRHAHAAASSSAIAFERVDLVAAREGEEALLRRRAMREIGLEHALDRARRVLRLDVAIELAAERRLRAEAAADQHVIALDRIGVLVHLHLAGEQADLADRNAARRNDGSR